MEVETDKAVVTHEADAALHGARAARRRRGERRRRRADRGRRRARRELPDPVASEHGAGRGIAPRPRPAVLAGAGCPGAPPATGPRRLCRASRQRCPAGRDGRVKASPLARRIAAELGVDLAALAGSGPQGRVIRADVEARGRHGDPDRADRQRPRRAERPHGQRAAKGTRHASRADHASSAPWPGGWRVARHRPRHRAARRGRHDRRGGAARAAARGRRATGCRRSTTSSSRRSRSRCASIPRVNGAYRDGAFETYARVNVGIAVAAPGHARRADGVRRRHQVARSRSPHETRALAAARARRLDHPGRARRRHVHRLEPRHVRRRQLLAR